MYKYGCHIWLSAIVCFRMKILISTKRCSRAWKLFKSQSQSWGFTSRSTARVILGQVLRIATCGTRTHRGDSL